MLKLADLIEEKTDELAKLEAASMGQPVAVAKGAMIPTCVASIRCTDCVFLALPLVSS